MNKQFSFFRTAIVATLLLALVSCSKTNKEGRWIPANAGYVVHINSNQLLGKLSWNEIKGGELIKDVLVDTTVPQHIRAVLNNLDKSGIDTTKDLSIFLVMDAEGSYMALTGSIKDADKFNTFNLDLTEGGFETQDGDVKLITATPLVIGYDKQKFIYFVNTPDFNKFSGWGNKRNKASRDIQQAIMGLFKMPEDKSLAKNARYTALMNDKADVHLWSNGEAMANSSPLGAAAMFSDVGKLTKDLISTASLTFNNGSISIKNRWYTSKELSAILKKHEGGNIDEAMVNKLPATGVNGVLVMNFKPEVIKEIIKLTGMDGLVSSWTKKEAGITLDDFVNANKGDLLLAMTNLHIKKDSIKWGSGAKAEYMDVSSPDMDVTFSSSIKDKQAFNKLVQAAQEKSKDFFSYEEDSVQQSKLSFNINDQYFTMASSKTALDTYNSGNNKNTDLLKMIGKGPIGGYADLQSIIKGGTSIETNGKVDSTGKLIYDLTLQMWDYALLKGGQIEDGALVLDLEVNLKDKNVNSLKQLNTYLQKIGTLQRQQHKKEMAEMDFDLMMPPPAPEEMKTPDTKKVPNNKK